MQVYSFHPLRLLYTLALAIGLPLTVLADHPPIITLHGFAVLSSPPFAWIDSCTGELTGSSQHILKKAFKENHAQLIIEDPLPPFSNKWQVKGRRLIDGSLDIFYGNNMNIYRIDKTLIEHNSTPATIVASGFFSLKNSQLKISRIEQSRGKKIGLPTALKSFVTATGLEKDVFDGMDIKDKIETREAINMLVDGEIDYIIGGKYRYNSIIRKMKKNTQLEFSPINSLARNLYFWHRSDNPHKDLFDQVLQTLQSYRENGYVDYMNKSYFLTWNNQPKCDIQ